jgi:hypothetical protein
VIIRYRGGPLNRRKFIGPSNQPKYRDVTGQPIPLDHGGQAAKFATIRRAYDEATYAYDSQHCEYVHIPLLWAEVDNQEEQ